jgi:hypothetical protein
MEIRGYIHIRTKIKVHQIKNKNKYQFLIVRHNIFLMEMMHRGHIIYILYIYILIYNIYYIYNIYNIYIYNIYIYIYIY